MVKKEELEPVVENNEEHEESAGDFVCFCSAAFHFVCFFMLMLFALEKLDLGIENLDNRGSPDIVAFGFVGILGLLLTSSILLAHKIKTRFHTRKMAEGNLIPAFKPRIGSEFESGFIGTVMHREAMKDFKKFCFTCWGVVYLIAVPAELIFGISEVLPVLSYLCSILFSGFMWCAFGMSFHSSVLLERWDKKMLAKLNVA